MLEQSHINPDDTDITRIKSEDTDGETILNPTLSAVQTTTSEEATRLMSSYGDGKPTDSELVLGSVVKIPFNWFRCLVRVVWVRCLKPSGRSGSPRSLCGYQSIKA
jgi:hypothetical protein